jgi:hypothetical protein
MRVIEDSRQQAGKHDNLSGLDLLRCKLPFGDYALPPKIAVDTKASLHEITQNLCGSQKERARFIRECKLAKECGSVLVFLIETGAYKTPADLIGQDILLLSGKRVPGVQLYRAMMIVSERYGCRFEFCPRAETGKRIMEILQDGR